MIWKLLIGKQKEKTMSKQISVTVYRYEELTEEIQEKILMKFAEWNSQDSYWYDNDYLLDPPADELECLKVNFPSCDKPIFSWKHLWFDLCRGYIQFDGLKVNDSEKFRQILGISEEVLDKIYWSFDEQREMSTRFIYEIDDPENDLTVDEFKMLQEAANKFNFIVRRAFKRLEEEYERITSKEYIIEEIEANDYWFYEDGRIV